MGLSEGIKRPGADVIRVRFRGISFFDRLGFVHVAVDHSHEGGGPVTLIARYAAVECLLYVAGIESDERVLAHLGPVDSFRSDLVDRSFGMLLGKARDAERDG